MLVCHLDGVDEEHSGEHEFHNDYNLADDLSFKHRDAINRPNLIDDVVSTFLFLKSVDDITDEERVI